MINQDNSDLLVLINEVNTEILEKRNAKEYMELKV
jgi:hypothetical protein